MSDILFKDILQTRCLTPSAEMPAYAFRARDIALNQLEGTIEAEDEIVAVTRLTAGGVYPITLTEARIDPARPIRLTGRRVSDEALVEMNRQFADLLGGGMPVSQALSLLSRHTRHRMLQAVLSEVAQAVRDGQALSDALACHPGVFSPLYLGMLRVGETGGELETALNRLADLLERDTELKSRVVSALVYPLVVLGLGLMTVVVLVTVVIPTLAPLFEETGQQLPLPTRCLLAISLGVNRWWWAGLLGIMGLAGILRGVKRPPDSRQTLNRFMLRLPILGALVQKLQLARFTRTLGLMDEQGIPIVQALEVAGGTLSNACLQRAVQGVREAVQAGESLAVALAASPQFPPFVSHLVAVGEESGTLGTALLNIASTYERETERLLRLLTTLLEPLLIIVVGLVVMGIVLSVLLPIFELGLVAQ